MAKKIDIIRFLDYLEDTREARYESETASEEVSYAEWLNENRRP